VGNFHSALDSVPDLLDAVVHPLLKINEGFAPPNLPLDLFSSNHFAWLGRDQSEDFEGLRWELTGAPALAQLTRYEVQLEDPKTKHRGLREAHAQVDRLQVNALQEIIHPSSANHKIIWIANCRFFMKLGDHLKNHPTIRL
jgi:hypothetical protein